MKIANGRYLTFGILCIFAFFIYTVAAYYVLRLLEVPFGSFENFFFGDLGFVFIVLSVNFFMKAFKKVQTNNKSVS